MPATSSDSVEFYGMDIIRCKVNYTQVTYGGSWRRWSAYSLSKQGLRGPDMSPRGFLLAIISRIALPDRNQILALNGTPVIRVEVQFRNGRCRRIEQSAELSHEVR